MIPQKFIPAADEPQNRLNVRRDRQGNYIASSDPGNANYPEAGRAENVVSAVVAR